MPGVGLSIPEAALRGAVADPATLALVARMTSAPDAGRVAAIDACVRALRGAGVWGKLHALYLLAAQDAQAARLNWLGASFELSAVNAPGFTVDRGYQGNGTSSYLDTGWSPDLGAQDSLSFGVWVLGNVAVTGGAGTGTAASVAVNARTGVGTASFRANAASAFTLAGQSDSRGWTLVNRSGAGACQGYRGAVEVANAATASAAPSSVSLCLGRFNSQYNTQLYAAAAIGASLSAGEAAGLYAALAAYLAAVGAA